MPTSRPLPVLEPDRLRRIPRSFAWIDHRLRRPGILDMMEPEEIGLYLFLVLAGDRHGLSCWRLDRIERFMPCFDRRTLWDARDELVNKRLIAFRSWAHGEPDGIWQVLAIPQTARVKRQIVLR